MKVQKARELLREDITKMDLEQLQKYRVKLLDAWRESKAGYGMSQAVEDGFYKVVMNEYSSGFSPVDIWLTKNLSDRLDETMALEAKLLSQP